MRGSIAASPCDSNEHAQGRPHCACGTLRRLCAILHPHCIDRWPWRACAWAARCGPPADKDPINPPPTRAGLAGARQAPGLERRVDAGDQRSSGAGEDQSLRPGTPQIAKQIAAHVRRREGRPALPHHRSLFPDRHAELDAHHAQRLRNSVHSRARHDPGRGRWQPAAPHLYGWAAASCGSGSQLSWPFHRALGEGHPRGRHRGLLPQAYLAVNEAVGVPNNGDMHIVERLHLQGPDTLPMIWRSPPTKLLTKPWNTTRKYYRQRARKYDIVEGVCAPRVRTPMPSTRTATRFSRPSNFTTAFPWDRIPNETRNSDSIIDRHGHRRLGRDALQRAALRPRIIHSPCTNRPRR